MRRLEAASSGVSEFSRTIDTQEVGVRTVELIIPVVGMARSVASAKAAWWLVNQGIAEADEAVRMRHDVVVDQQEGIWVRAALKLLSAPVPVHD